MSNHPFIAHKNLTEAYRAYEHQLWARRKNLFMII